MNPGVESAYVQLDGLRLHYLRAGQSGSPVLLLHGGGIDSASLSYGPSLPLIAREHRVWAPDLPGYGESDTPRVTYTTEYYVGIVERFMEAMSLASASLVGVSLGGAITLGLALQAPARVEKLVLVDSHGLGREVPYGCLGVALVRAPLVDELTYAALRRSRALTRWSLEALLHNRRAVTPELVDETYRLMKQPRAGEAWHSFQLSDLTLQGIRTNYTGRLREVKAPTLLLHAERDNLVPLAWAERAQRLMPNARLVVAPDSGHWLPREDPEWFSRQVLAFLAG